MQRGRPPGTAISVKFSSGTSVQPMRRAATAGNCETQIRREREQRRGDVVGRDAVLGDDLAQQPFGRVEQAAPLRRDRRVIAPRTPRTALTRVVLAGFGSVDDRAQGGDFARRWPGESHPARASPSAIGPKRIRTRLDDRMADVRRTSGALAGCALRGSSRRRLETSRGATRRRASAPAARGPSSSFTPLCSSADLLRRIKPAAQRRAVRLLDAEARMRQYVRERAVIGEQQHAGGVVVEPADRDDAPFASLARAARRRRAPAFGIAHRRDHAQRLVHHEVGGFGRGRDDPAADTRRRRSSTTDVPSSRTTRPFTRTRPPTISSSERRRDAIPLAARYR